MKKIKYLACSLSLVFFLNACEQENIQLEAPPCAIDPANCPDLCASADAGSADFTKFITIGNSFVAGVQGGALFTEGQENSLAAILNRQFECVGAPETFNQPDINAELGWNLFITQPFLSNNANPILGRMLLQYGDNKSCATGAPSPLPTPQAYAPGELEALPNPTFNPGFMYTGSKTELNNFAVPAVTIGQLLTPATGNWGDPDPAKGFTPFYGRFASNPGTSRIITDAAAAGGTFFLFWAGLDDFLLYAAFGGDPTKAPLTSASDFGTRLGGALSPASPIGLLGLNPSIKGVIGNFPDIFKMPHFTLVAYNPIPLDAGTAGALTAGFDGYNDVMDALVANKDAFGISNELAAEISSRKVEFVAGCSNKIMLIDETLVDLGGYFDQLKSLGIINDAQRAGLVPYEQIRQSTPEDIIPLSAGSVLGEDGTFGALGVTEPVGDQYVIIPSERDEINAARDAFNAAVQTLVSALPDRLALADVEAAIDGFTGLTVEDGVSLTPNLTPPTGIYSEDGLHFNARGYAYIADVFIDAINATYGASIPSVNVGQYTATGLPIP
jgi:hypothetical protein